LCVRFVLLDGLHFTGNRDEAIIFSTFFREQKLVDECETLCLNRVHASSVNVSSSCPEYLVTSEGSTFLSGSLRKAEEVEMEVSKSCLGFGYSVPFEILKSVTT
jgi:hypothetical protein